MQVRTIEIQNGWLHLPIGREAPRHYVRFEADGAQLAELYLGLVSEEPDFWCAMENARRQSGEAPRAPTGVLFISPRRIPPRPIPRARRCSCRSTGRRR